MKKIHIGIVVVVILAALMLSGCSTETTKPNTVDKESGITNSGSYESYAPEKISNAKGNTVLFFHASWCPSCRGLDSDIAKNLESIPSDLTILKLDYDTQAALKQKYEVTTQHTLVQVDNEGNVIKKWSGGSTLERLVSQVA